MKMPNDLFEYMLTLLKSNIIELKASDPLIVRNIVNNYKRVNKSFVCLQWDLLNASDSIDRQTFYNWAYNDYRLNDNHIQTALNKAFKMLGINP